jgi:hypothetical protein
MALGGFLIGELLGWWEVWHGRGRCGFSIVDGWMDG